VYWSRECSNNASVGRHYYLFSPFGEKKVVTQGFSQSSPFDKGGYTTSDALIIKAIEEYEKE
jgi:hypothetical protein